MNWVLQGELPSPTLVRGTRGHAISNQVNTSDQADTGHWLPWRYNNLINIRFELFYTNNLGKGVTYIFLRREIIIINKFQIGLGGTEYVSAHGTPIYMLRKRFPRIRSFFPYLSDIQEPSLREETKKKRIKKLSGLDYSWPKHRKTYQVRFLWRMKL